MWEYNYTRYPDELYHWKYLSRFRKNGKWQYIYDKMNGAGKGPIANKITGNPKQKYRFVFKNKLSDYRKALSSKDEVEAYNKAKSKNRIGEVPMKVGLDYLNRNKLSKKAKDLKDTYAKYHPESKAKSAKINDYKKALSSDDEAQRYAKVSAKQDNLSRAAENLKYSNNNEAFKKANKAQSDHFDKEYIPAYAEYQTRNSLKKKVKDVKDTYNKYHPETKAKINDYKKALSSDDEAQRYAKVSAKQDNLSRAAENLKYSNNNEAFKKANKAQSDHFDKEYIPAYADYMSRNSMSKKVKDVKDTYNKYHPKKKKGR